MDKPSILRVPLFTLLILFLMSCQNSQKKDATAQGVEWVVADLLKEKSDAIQINGEPKLVQSPYGEAVYFDGVDDALFLTEMPLKSLGEFTVEMIFSPDSSGLFEQRVLHMGEVSADRMLLEIRAVDGNWYFDGFAASGTNKLALIDENLIHPLAEWHHVAFIISSDSLITYVNSMKELQEPYSFLPIETGRTSIGVRLNERSWFKGMIYKIRVTPKQLKPVDFMPY